jgi:signal transduction histidine kinase|tara:strand:- start:2462 stop:3235 length:774 start_codon:yes stop_codon:yes gene_type:complete
VADLRLARKVGAPKIDGAFYSHARHDVRSPLTAILGFAESMDEGIYGPLGHEKYAEYARAILESGRGLERFLSALLAILSLDAGELYLNEDECSVEHLFDELKANWNSEAGDWNIALEFASDADLPNLYADRHRLLQALDCIVENALRFTGAGGRVAISAATDAADDLLFAVEDTGPGLTDEDMDTALLPFGRIEGAAAHDGPGGGPGPGLGINLAAGLMALHQGTLSISSVPGQGTRAELTIPKARLRPAPGQPKE